MKIAAIESLIPKTDVKKALHKSLDQFELTIGIIAIIIGLGIFYIHNQPRYELEKYYDGYYNMAPVEIAKPSTDIIYISHHNPGGQ